MSEQDELLLTREEKWRAINNYEYKHLNNEDALLTAQVAKLKAMGYVKWDKGKVVQTICDACDTESCGHSKVSECPFASGLADQLKEILTGEESND